MATHGHLESRLRRSASGLCLLALAVVLVPEAHCESPKVAVREGKIPPELVRAVYQLALDQLALSHNVKEVPKLDVYFVASLQPERFSRGREMRWSFSYPKPTADPNEPREFLLEEAVVVMRKEGTWELWSESTEFNLLFTVLMGALDYANQLYIDPKQEESMRAAAFSHWMCQTGRACDWRQLASGDAKKQGPRE